MRLLELTLRNLKDSGGELDPACFLGPVSMLLELDSAGSVPQSQEYEHLSAELLISSSEKLSSQEF